MFNFFKKKEVEEPKREEKKKEKAMATIIDMSPEVDEFAHQENV